MRKKRLRAIYAAFEKEHGRPPARADLRKGFYSNGIPVSPSERRRARKEWRRQRQAGRV